MKALSIRQPWAFLILAGIPELVPVPVPDRPTSHTLEPTGRLALKDVENRKWSLPKGFDLPQRIYVHASLRVDNCLDALFKMGVPPMFALAGFSPQLAKRGAIVGEVDITGCVTESNSPWFSGPYGFTLANPKPYKYPIPYKGHLGFFDVQLQGKEAL